MNSRKLRVRVAFLVTLSLFPMFWNIGPARAAACSVSVSTFAQLQSAFTTCNTGGGGIINVTGDIDTTARLLYTGAGTLTIQSDQIGVLRKIRATGTRSWGVIESNSGALEIDSLEITGGNGSTYGIYGGGVQGWRNLTVRNSYIHDNSAGYGGGLGLGYIDGATPWKTFNLQYSRLESNTATAASTASSGGYYSLNGYETATMIGSSIMYNRNYAYGSALNWRTVNTTSTFTITNSTIAYNVATSTTGAGGTVAYNYGRLNLYFTTFLENTTNSSSNSGIDIYCGTNNQCSMHSVGTVFANNRTSSTCYVNSTARYATYSVSNIGPSNGASCLKNINSAGVVQTAQEATNVTSTVANMYLASEASFNGGKTPNYAITNSASTLMGVVPSSVGSLYTTIDQRGVARTGSAWSAGAYERSLVAAASNIALSFPAGAVIYRQSKTLTASSNSAPGKITFYANGKRISGCLNKVISSSNSYTATCNWKPTIHGAVVLSARFTPTDSSAFADGTSSPIYVGVATRGTFR